MLVKFSILEGELNKFIIDATDPEGPGGESVTELEKKKIMRRLEQLDGVQLFNEVRERKQRVIERITNNVKENMEKAYWDSIKSKMETNPPDYTVIIPLLKQIIIYIC